MLAVHADAHLGGHRRRSWVGAERPVPFARRTMGHEATLPWKAGLAPARGSYDGSSLGRDFDNVLRSPASGIGTARSCADSERRLVFTSGGGPP